MTDKILDAGYKYEIIEELALEKRNFVNIIKSIIKLAKVLKNNKIDIVHTHNAASVFMANAASVIANRKIKFFKVLEE